MTHGRMLVAQVLVHDADVNEGRDKLRNIKISQNT